MVFILKGLFLKRKYQFKKQTTEKLDKNFSKCTCSYQNKAPSKKEKVLISGKGNTFLLPPEKSFKKEKNVLQGNTPKNVTIDIKNGELQNNKVLEGSEGEVSNSVQINKPSKIGKLEKDINLSLPRPNEPMYLNYLLIESEKNNSDLSVLISLEFQKLRRMDEIVEDFMYHSMENIYSNFQRKVKINNPLNFFPVLPDKKRFISFNKILFFEKYFQLFMETPLKEECNTYIKSLLKDSSFLCKESLNYYLKINKVTSMSPERKLKKEKTFSKDYSDIEKFKCIPYHYQRNNSRLSNSPLLFPQFSKMSILSKDPWIRLPIYNQIEKYTKEKGLQKMVILSLKLVNPYFSILSGLFPDFFDSFSKNLGKDGLIYYIRDELEKKNNLKWFFPPIINTCFFSCLDLTLNKDILIEALGAYRNVIRKTESEFEKIDTSEKERILTFVHNATSETINSALFLKIKYAAKVFYDIFSGKLIEGPTGDKFLISPISSYQCSFLHYLESFEFFILGQSTVYCVDYYKNKNINMELIFHFHDNNVFLVPEIYKEEITSYFIERVSEISKSVGLYYPLKIEVEEISYDSIL